ncbi:MAG: alpha/beta hydrolase [Tepidiformaceae bacterium]
MDAQVEALLQMMAAQAQATGAPPMWTLPPVVARAGAETGFAAFNTPMPAGVALAGRAIPGPAGDITAMVFTPTGEGPFPLLVYIHGGGWVIGSPATHQKLCAELALGAGVVVVSPHYRLAPEHPAPAALDDCLAAIEWAVAHASELGADGSRLAIGGDSAGANLTAAACQCLRDAGGPPVRLQLLLYGAFDHDFDRSSYKRNGTGYILELDAIKWFWEQYLAGGADPTGPGVSPARGKLEGLPPAHLIVGSLDPLLDDSTSYAEKLKAAGVPATLSIYPDMPHVFLQLSAMLDGGKKGVAECCDVLRRALA